jgi:hypothetical protein
MIRFLLYLYFIIIVVTEFSIFGTQNFLLILSAFLAPLIGWMAGSRIRECFYANKKRKLFNITISLAFLLIAYCWMYLTQFTVILFSLEINGTIWVTKGFLLGFMLSEKKEITGLSQSGLGGSGKTY